MEQYRNKEVRKYIAVLCVSSAVMICMMGLLTYVQCQNYRKTESIAIQAIINETIRENPDADISLLMSILESPEEYWENLKKEEQEEVEQLLFKYGISDKDYSVAEMKTMEHQMIGINVGLTFVLECVFLWIFLCYIRKRSRRLDELTGYMELISRGRYDLDLADNSEDELSNLKNQIYKMTVAFRELADQSKQQKVALADSVSDISHQLKTPLTSASILLDNLNDSEDMDEETRKRFIREISKQVFSMNWMIIAMLKLSRFDAGVVELELKKYSVNRMIEEAMDNLEVIAELKEVQIVTEGMEQEVTLDGDPNWNREAVQNVVKNAIEHSESQDAVTIQLEDNSVYCAIHIRNQGQPITKEDQKKIFERHYSATGADNQSFGIGLPLAKAIIEKQNGYLTVESDEKSTCFTLKYRK